MCVLFVAVLHFMPDEEDPAAVVGRYRDAVPAGSHVVVSHAAVEEQRNREVGDAYRSASAPFVARTREQVTALLDGLELVAPGVVRLHGLIFANFGHFALATVAYACARLVSAVMPQRSADRLSWWQDRRRRRYAQRADRRCGTCRCSGSGPEPERVTHDE